MNAVTHFVAVSDLSQPLASQEGILIEVRSKAGNIPRNQVKALAIAQQMWENGEIEADKFPDGLTQEHIVYVPPEQLSSYLSQAARNPRQVPPLIQGAQEIVELTKLQLEVQEVATEAEPYLPIIQAVLQGTRPLTAKEKDLVQNKHFAKTLEKLAATIVKQETYRENCPGYGKLILNALNWQLNKGVKESTPTPPKTTSRKRSRSIGNK